MYISDSLVLTQLKSHLPLHQTKDERRVLYVCAIAFQLSQAKNILAMEIASKLTTLIRQTNSNLITATQPDLTIQAVLPGWIHLELTDTAIAAWLQHLTQTPLCWNRGLEGDRGEKKQIHSPSTSRLFAVQYAHARCCSLLQLAQRDQLITLKQFSSDQRPIFWLITPEPVPWLNSDHKLYLTQPAERVLIAQLVSLLDQLYCPSPWRQLFNWEKAALNLSQAFQTFHCYCRIWGEVKVQTLQLAQARLGLVIITQSVLGLLLQDIFNVSAPLEL